MEGQNVEMKVIKKGEIRDRIGGERARETVDGKEKVKAGYDIEREAKDKKIDRVYMEKEEERTASESRKRMSDGKRMKKKVN